MKKVSPWFCLLFLICSWLFLGLYALNLEFYAKYHVPFGMSDIDRYVSWQGYDISYRTEYSRLDRQAYLIHGFFLETVKLLGGVYALNWFIPLLIVSCILAVYWLYSKWGFSDFISFFGSILFAFGSFFMISFYVVAFYAQLYGSFLILLALIFYAKKQKTIFVLCLFFSVLAHLILIYFWIMFCLSELAYHKRYLTGIIVTMIFFILSIFYGVQRYSSFYPHPVPEPNMYVKLAIFTFPLVFVFLFNSPIKTFRYKYMIAFLFLITPLIHLGRGLVYLSLFITPLAVIGFFEFRKQVKYWYWFMFFIIVFFLFWLDYTWSFQMKNMLEQMSLRGMGENMTFNNLFI